MRRFVLGFVLAFAASSCVAVAASASGTYLSDLPFTLSGLKYYSEAYFDGVRVDGHASIRTLSGSQSFEWDGPTKIAGQTYDEGLTFHMEHDETMKATWALAGRYTKLTATVGLDDYQGSTAEYPHVTVKFVGDGKVLATADFTSVYGKVNPTPSVEADLTGVKSLEIAVTMVGAGGTNLDVVNPELTMATPKP